MRLSFRDASFRWHPDGPAALEGFSAELDFASASALERAIARFGDDAPEGLSQLVIGGAALGAVIIQHPRLDACAASLALLVGLLQQKGTDYESFIHTL